MKKMSVPVLGMIFVVAVFVTSGIGAEDETVLKGPYLGQKPPGLSPQIFAPGIISGELSEGCSAFLEDGIIFIFRRSLSREKDEIYEMFLKNGIWTKPQPVSFKSPHYDGDFTVAPDGKTIYFSSRRSTVGGEEASDNSNIWKTEKCPRGWSTPVLLKAPVSSDKHDSYPTVDRDGTLYFFCRDRGGFGKSDIFLAREQNGGYAPLENLGENINSPEHEWDPYIAPDGSYLIFCSTKPGGMGSDDFYISFKNKDGSWTRAVHMGEGINSADSENRPYVTLDGKYFFFTSTRSGRRDIYWVDAKILESFRPHKLK
jgi:Tol biopolymer transport system component